VATPAYEAGEKEQSYQARFVTDYRRTSRWGHLHERWYVYDFGVGRHEMAESKQVKLLGADGKPRYANFEQMRQRLNQPLPWVRQLPRGCSHYQCKILEGFLQGCTGGLLKPPGNKKPFAFILGSTDDRGDLLVNFNLHIARGRSFWRFLHNKLDRGIARRTRVAYMYRRYYRYRANGAKRFFPNNSVENRAKNRSVRIEHVGGRRWSVRAQRRQARREFNKIVKEAEQKIAAGARLIGEAHLAPSLRAKYREAVKKICSKLRQRGIYDRYLTTAGVDYYLQHEWGFKKTYNVPPDYIPPRGRIAYIKNKRTGRYKAYRNPGVKRFKAQVIDLIVCARKIEDVVEMIDIHAYRMFRGAKHAQSEYQRYAQIGGTLSYSAKRIIVWLEGPQGNSGKIKDSNSLYNCFDGML